MCDRCALRIGPSRATLSNACLERRFVCAFTMPKNRTSWQSGWCPRRASSRFLPCGGRRSSDTRLPHALPGEAEPAVVVADAYQRKGLGTIVLGQLTQAAIAAGISMLEARARLQQELVEVCRAAGMRLIGPNCMGIVKTDPEVRLDGQSSP
jgi:GNAT superfamily N-acetyltransferase